MYRVTVEDSDGAPIGDDPVTEFEDEIFAHHRAENLLETFLKDGDLDVTISILGPDGKVIFSLTPAGWAAGAYLFRNGLYTNLT